jgi:hypothetical protein
MAQVDPVALRLRDLVYTRIINNYHPNICVRLYSDDAQPVPSIRFLKPPNRTYCTILFYNNRVSQVLGLEWGLNHNISLQFNPNWTEDHIVIAISNAILRGVKYPSRSNAQYRPEQPGTHCANPDLAAVFLALRARIELLRALLQ